MDIFSHGLWAGAAAKSANTRRKKQLRVWLAGFFGIFPDLFAFAIGFTYLQILRISGKTLPYLVRPGEVEPPIEMQSFFMRLTHHLYDLSHSLFVFFVIFGLVAWHFRRPIWEMGGWGLHIIMDIPTHSYAFFPTPFLWPFFDWKFNGWHWGTPEFLVVNYSLLAAVYFVLWIVYNRKRKEINC